MTATGGVTRIEVTCEDCGKNDWGAEENGGYVTWFCRACGATDTRHPLVENPCPKERTEEDL